MEDTEEWGGPADEEMRTHLLLLAVAVRGREESDINTQFVLGVMLIKMTTFSF